MVKNPHPPRNGGKAPAADAAKDTDASKSKSKKTSSKQATPAAATATPPKDDAPKPLTTKQLIGGASWTGKLPVNLLSELCQKQKWDKPEYTMSKTPDGFYSTVIMRSKNPKTQEVTILPPMRIPESHRHLEKQPSAVEARHFAATWALFRTSSGKNMHMMLPPTYKDLWKGAFQDVKKEEVAAGKDGLYAADPFQARRDFESSVADRDKKRQEIEKERRKREEQKESGAVLSDNKDYMRGWKTAPKVEMGRKMRREVESLVRTRAAWNLNGLKMSRPEHDKAVEAIAAMGFRKAHAQEAASICKDREEALEWLLVHIPEDDLPKWSLPEGYAAGVSMASGDLKKEGAIKRLASGGYASELCQQAYEDASSDEAKAAQKLQDTLLYSSADEALSDKLQMASLETGAEEDVWSEEQAVLESIYERRYKLLSPTSCEIKLETQVQGKPLLLQAYKPTTGAYPRCLPVILVQSATPAYIRLSITRQALLHAAENFLDEQMLFNIVDWIEHEVAKIVESPGRLSDISAVSSTGSSAVPARQQAQRGSRNKRHPQSISWVPGSAKSKSIKSDWATRQQSPKQKNMISSRQKLPAWSLQEAVVSAVERFQVVIVSGETGSGKSTQSVQFILDDMIQRELGDAAKIICTQPRRISALGLADRVSDERCSKVGDEVGYAIRGESKQGPNTKLTFCTTGVLLRRLQTSGGTTEDIMASIADVSHIFVDEVHERTLDTDFLLTLLRDVLKKRSDLKVILMSATLEANIFEQYFGGSKRVGKVEIQGRTHPVEDLYLDDVVRMTGYQAGANYSDFDDDTSVSKAIQGLGMGINYDLIAALVQEIDRDLGSSPGAILIFLPGTLEITRTLDALGRIPKLHALPLHASLLPAEQRRVFPSPPSGKRKVIASTNVAETSITIPDVVAVIDSGRVKETRYDPQSSMVRLEEVWASKAACKQRRGRAGRVQAGTCYKLFTRAAEGKMAERPDAEIRRVPLEQLCLSVKAMGVADVAGFLGGTITPPDVMAVESALNLLRRLGALEDGQLTALGQNMAMVPADLRLAKLMIYGALFGCLEATVTIASILTVKSPFVSPQAKRDEAKAARESFGAGIGDPLIDLRAYDAWRENRATSGTRDLRQWCDANFLSMQTLNDISSTRAQYVATLQEIGFLQAPPSDPALNRNSASLPILHALLASALYPNTVRVLYPPQKYTATATGSMAVDPSAKEIKLFSEDNARAFIHPSSTLFSAQSFPSGAGPSAPFLSYWSKVATSKAFVREVAPVGVFGALLLAGPRVAIDELGRGLVLDGWVRVRGWARIGVLVGRLRGVVDQVLRRWVEEPGAGAAEAEAVVGLCRRLVELDGLDA